MHYLLRAARWIPAVDEIDKYMLDPELDFNPMDESHNKFRLQLWRDLENLACLPGQEETIDLERLCTTLYKDGVNSTVLEKNLERYLRASEITGPNQIPFYLEKVEEISNCVDEDEDIAEGLCKDSRRSSKYEFRVLGCWKSRLIPYLSG
jgi:hypothetical protein